MTQRQMLILVILGGLNVLVFCIGGALVFAMMSAQTTATVSQVMVTPTPTFSWPATWTPTPMSTIEPTRSSSQATRPEPTRAAQSLVTPSPRPTTQSSATILNAMSKSQQVSAYRIQLDMSATGVTSGAGVSASQEMSLINLAAEMSGKDSHVTMKGMLAALFTGDTSGTFEIISVGDKQYLKGPMPMLGVKDNKWYYMADGKTTQSQNVSPDQFYKSFTNGEVDLTSFTKTRTENLDGQKCDVYSADQTQLMNALLSNSAELNLSSTQLQQLQQFQGKTEMALWICADGFVHQMKMGMEGKDSSGKTGGFNMLIHVYDFNGVIKITAPANASTMTNPFLITSPTPTPKK